MQRALIFTLALLFVSVVQGIEVEGVSLPDSVEVSGTTLQLNGAGVRTKFFFDIYVGALYLPAKVTEAAEALAMTGSRQVSMTFLYDEVSQEKMVAAWDEGFRLNLSADQLTLLRQRLEEFNAFFVTVHRGDTYVFEFLANGATRVVLNGKEAGRIMGSDFQKALLSVWLGDTPADNGLKAAMLGE